MKYKITKVPELNLSCYEHDNGGKHYNCAQDGVWLPGLYDSIEACKMAIEFDDKVLHNLWWITLNPNMKHDKIRFITVDILKKLDSELNQLT